MGGGGFSTNYREENLISRLESSRQSQWSRQLHQLNDVGEQLAQRLAMKLVDEKLVETTNQRELEQQLSGRLNELQDAEDFDIQFAIAEIRNLVPRPNRMSLYITAFVIENLMAHRCVVDVFGTDEEIYAAVDNVVTRLIK